MTPRTPSPPSNMEVETLCFDGVFLLRGQDNCTISKERYGWSHVPPGDGYSSMKMPQNTNQDNKGVAQEEAH